MTRSVAQLIDLACSAVTTANREASRLDPECLTIDGMSTSKVRHLLNALCGLPDTLYLEVGAYKGSTLCSAISRNDAQLVLAYENYTEFDQTNVRDCLHANIARHRGAQRVLLVERDFFASPPHHVLQPAPRFNVFFYDGQHTTETQYRFLSVAKSTLAPAFILLVDDWQCAVSHARDRAFAAINDFQFRSHLYIELPAGSDAYHGGQGLFVLENLSP